MSKKDENRIQECKYNQISTLTNVLFHFIFIIVALLCIIPFMIIISASLSSESDLIRYGYNLIPRHISFESYGYLWDNARDIVNAYGVTIFNTVVGTVIAVFITSLCAYPLSRPDFKYKSQLSFFLFFTMLFSGGLVPWYLVCTQILHLQDTVWAMIVPSLCSAWNIVVMRTFMQSSIPDSLTECAKIEGAGDFRIFFKIILPLSLPGLATIGLFTAIGYWNDWWLPLILINEPKLSNLQYYLYRIMANVDAINKSSAVMGDAGGAMKYVPTENVRMAICLIAVGPIVLSYPFFQKYFVKGLTVGAVKG